MKKADFNAVGCISMANNYLISVLQRIGSEKEMHGRTGGYLCIADKTGHPLCIAPIGEMPEEKRKQYFRNAVEKAERLAYTSKYAGHLFSRTSRDEKREQWGGAISGTRFIWSFSGLPEDGDEIFMAILAAQRGDLTRTEVGCIEMANNVYFEKLKKLFSVSVS